MTLKSLQYQEFYATLLDYAKSIDNTNADLAKNQSAFLSTECLTNINSRQGGYGNGNHEKSGGQCDGHNNKSGGHGNS